MLLCCCRLVAQSCLTFFDPMNCMACQAPLDRIPKQVAFPPPVDHVLSALSTLIHRFWVSLRGVWLIASLSYIAPSPQQGYEPWKGWNFSFLVFFVITPKSRLSQLAVISSILVVHLSMTSDCEFSFLFHWSYAFLHPVDN